MIAMRYCLLILVFAVVVVSGKEIADLGSGYDMSSHESDFHQLVTPAYEKQSDSPEMGPDYEGNWQTKTGMPIGTGPKFGLPGYKESHNWETPSDDIFNRIVFDYKFYSENNNLNGKSRPEILNDWKVYLESGATYPNCRRGTLNFDLNTYLEGSPAIRNQFKGNCLEAMKFFMTNGMYAGGSGGFVELIRDRNNGNSASWTTSIEHDLGSTFSKFTDTYVLTMWLKVENAGGMNKFKNIMKMGSNTEVYPKAPGIYQYPSTITQPVSRLQFVVAQTGDPDFSCDPEVEPEVGKWVFIALAVKPTLIKVYYDTKLVCSKESGGEIGQTLIPGMDERVLWASDKWSTAEVLQQNLRYYPDNVKVHNDLEKEPLHAEYMEQERPQYPKNNIAQSKDDPYALPPGDTDFAMGPYIDGPFRQLVPGVNAHMINPA